MAKEHEVQLPVELLTKLSRLNSQVRRLAFLRGSGLFVVVIALLLAAGMLVDFQWELATSVRVGILLSFTGITAAVAWMSLVRPLSRRLQTAELAAVVERAHPELLERLTSTVELNDPNLPEVFKGSPYMRQLLLRQTVKSSAGIDFSGSVSARRAMRWLCIGAFTVIMLASPFVWSPSAYGLMWSRFFQPWGNHDRVANFLFDVENGNRVVARGTDVNLTVKIDWRGTAGERPETVRMNWRDVTGATDSRRLKYNSKTDAYTAVISHVFSGFDYNISAAGNRSRQYHIQVVEAPEIAEVTLDIASPSHTGIPAVHNDGVVGTIAVVEQSKLTFRLKFNKPITASELRWLNLLSSAATETEQDAADTDESVKYEPVTAVRLSTDGESAELRLTATVGGPFDFLLTDKHGLSNSDEPQRILEIIPDRPPVLTLAGSSRFFQARPDDVVNIQATVIDDFGVDALELHYQIEQGDPHIIAVPAADLGGLSVAHQFDLDLESLQLAHGTTVTLRVRAADQRETPGPNEVWSEPRVLLIDRSAKPLGSDVVAERQQQLRQKLQQIQADLKTNHAKLTEIKTEANADIRMQLQFGRDKELAPLADGQAELAERLEALASEFAEHPLYSNLTAATRKVARIPLTDAARGTRKSTEQPLKEKADTLGKVDDTLAQAEADLAAIEARFDELAKIETELLEINRLAQQFEKKAKELAAQARDQQQQQQKPPASETPEQAQQREEQVAQQQEMLQQSEQDLAELARQLKELLNQQPELAEAAREQELDRLAELSRRALELAEPQDLLADALREESKEAANELAPLAKKQEEILREAEKLAAEADPNKGPVTPLDPDALRKALDELKKGNLTAAIERQKEAADELDRLGEELKKNDQLPADPQKAVGELARRQRELEKKIAQAAKDAPKDAATPDTREEQERKLRPLAAEQAALQAGIARQQLPQKNRKQQQETVNDAAEAVNKLLAADPKTAAEAAAKTAEDLEQLARQIGSEDERNAQAQREVAELRKEQQEIRKEVAKATEKQKTVRNADQAKAELLPLAEKQKQIARKLAEIDAPAAEQEQREALRKAARAMTDLKKTREQDVNTSQAQTEQALARLEKKLADEELPEQAVAKLRKQQQQLNRDADDALKKSDKQKLASNAREQRQIADELAKVDAPAAREEQQAAREAAEAAAQKLAKAETIGEVADALKQVDEALQRLEQAIDPDQQNNDAAKQAEQLAKRQQTEANDTKKAADAKEAPTAQQREQAKNDLAAVARQAERLRAGDAAQKEKRDALETLQKAADAQQKVDDLAQQQEQLAKNGDPKPKPVGDPKDPNNKPRTPEELENELQRAIKDEAQAQQQAADALQQLSKKLAGDDAKQQRRQEDQQAEQLAQPNNQSAEQLAEAAEQLADKQAELRKQVEQLASEENAEKRAEVARQLAKQQDELRKQTEQLPSQQAALQRGDAAKKMEQASRSLQQDAAPQAAAEQQQAEQALRDVAQKARAAAQAENKPMNQPADQQQTAERAAELAQQQRDLEKQVAQLQQDRAAAQQKQAAANDADPQSPEGQPQQGQPTPAQQAQAQQQQLAQKAAELALKTAAETGVVSPATKRAAEFARQAAETAKQATAGQLQQAKNDAAQAAKTGEEAAKQLAADGSPQAPQLGEQAQKLAQQQRELGEQFGEMAQSAASRAQAQQAGQQQLQAATNQLAQELAESAERLSAQPVGLSQKAQQAQGAQQAAQQAAQAMKQAQQQLAQGNNADAAQAAKQAADALREAAELAAGPPMMVNGEGSPSPVPGNVGDQVAEANRRLEQARQQLADAQAQQQSGQPQSGEAGQPGEQPAEQGQPGEPGQQQPGQPGQQGQQQPGQPGQQGQPQSPLQQSAQNLQQAADALAQAARQLQQPGQKGQPGQPGGQESQQASQDPPDDPSDPGDGGEGKGAQATLDLTRLEIELKNLAGRDWGRLPGELRTEIMQGAKKQSNSDYARLIKLYFREIAKPQTGTPARGTKP
jgi:hypothetical protein